MAFNSYGFLFLFLPILLFAVWGIQKEKKENFMIPGLVFASVVFYAVAYPKSLIWLALSISVTYVLHKSMLSKPAAKKGRLIIGLIFHIGLLAFLKYGRVLWGFSGEFMNAPGVSFYTFTMLAFLVETYRGNIGETGVWNYALYVTFFPKLLEGPIVLPKDFLEIKRKKLTWERAFRALFLVSFGLFKKVILADTLGSAVDYGYANLSVLNSPDAVIVMLSYTLQLYFDFSGYCDMGMGIASLVGFDLPVNFDSPYQATDIVDFWRRWHITLTQFFTQYVYIPLGGNRKGKARTYLNYLIVFFISGLWHGVGFTFIIWGLMHGGLFAVTRFVKDRKKNRVIQTKDDKVVAMPKRGGIVQGISVFFTFLYVNVAWVFFRASNVKEAVTLLKKIATGGIGKLNWNLAGCFNLDELWYILKVLKIAPWGYAQYIWMFVILLGLLLWVLFGKNAIWLSKKVKPKLLTVMIMVVFFFWSILSFSGVNTYLYMNF